MAEKELRTMAQGLVLIALVLAIIALGVWIRPATVEPAAGAATPTTDRSVAGIPDSGLQRQTMIEELKKLNDRLAAIEEGLKEGRFQIQSAEKAPSAEKP
ncbi:MAG: hypothetical protein WBD63_05035 [Phycisphaerae bacterium]|nr:hypothetical protein [Phycisphaerae bacterium]